MPESRRLQSEQGIGSQFDSFLANFQGFSSYSMANFLMQYTAALLIQLSLADQAVKLAESLISGSIFAGSELKAIAGKLDERLSGLYQGYASQLKMTMLHEEPFLKSPQILQKAGEKLNENLNTLSGKNLERNLAMKKQLGPDAASKDDKKDDYTPPKPKGSF
ncbi:MAG: hypothetical protein V4501_06615 [Pseudomonadota bacterium]